jgi:cell division protein FtsI (penicillin-binding protein 3)
MKRMETRGKARSIQTESYAEATSHRMLALVAVLAFWILAIGLRLVFLQAINTDWYKVQALQRQRKMVTTDASRGVIFDRHGRELARTVDAPSFFVIPGEIENINELSKRVTAIVGGDPHELADRLQRAKDTNQKFAWVVRKIDEPQAEQLRALNITGMDSRPEPKRTYPNGGLAAHVLGFVSRDNRGLGGIEQTRESDISGEAGTFYIDRDAERRPYASTLNGNHDGDAVTLTIDQTMQFHVEKLLEQAVKDNGAKAATAVVMDPHTGEILALANYPSFDPNDPTGVAATARVNNALQNYYEPGSTFKLVTYAAALEAGLVHPQDTIDCLGGSITVAGRVIKDTAKYGSLTATEALAKSSNVAAIKLGIRVGNQGMYDTARLFGFGNRTGIELPGESLGLLRAPSKWGPSSIGSVAMGQEVAVTALQITSAFGTVANNGVRVTPHIVKEIRDQNGEVTFRGNASQTQVISVRTAQTLRHMLESVTVSGGTAQKAHLDGYTAAGKTGTAQKIDPHTHAYSGDKYIASFVGFTPVDNPAVVISVIVDEPRGAHHGGDVAAPVFRSIAEQILPILNVEPDIDGPKPPVPARAETESAPAKPAAVQPPASNASLPRVERNSGNNSETVYVNSSKRAMLMPDLRGRSLRDVATVCAQMGLQLDARGTGRAVRQTPAKGRELGSGQVIRVEFARSD